MYITIKHHRLREGSFPKKEVEAMSDNIKVTIFPSENDMFVDDVEIYINSDDLEGTAEEINTAYKLGEVIGMMKINKIAF